MSEFQEAIDFLQELQEERDFSKRCKEQTTKIITLLGSKQELCVNKALLELEELNTFEMPSYHRTQIWDVISILESTKI
jgi:uncharacterized protein (UPF0147 family)